MDKQELFKEVLSNIISQKFSLYGQAIVTKVESTGSVRLSSNGSVISIMDDPKQAIENVLLVFRELSGNIGVTSATAALKSFAFKNPDVKPEIDEVVRKF